MGLYFGTDGIRGLIGKELTLDLAFRCGKALALKKENVKILIGRDTRASGQILTNAFSLGVILNNGLIEDIGICPTAGISYLTMQGGYDYGVVISASHNYAEYNGIKIFDCKGEKLGDKIEYEIEKNFFKPTNQIDNNCLGEYKYIPSKIKQYYKFLLNKKIKLNNLKIILDCANGASFKIAPKVLKKLGAEVFVINNKPNGKNINKNCGAIDIEKLKKTVLSKKADIGFAFDGDSDRVIAVDERGNIVDGDMIIYLFAIQYKKAGKLNCEKVVGTIMTNQGIEDALNKEGISLIRTQVGDKYVGEELVNNNLLIGGEQCGHIFLKDELATGDGILNAILISQICQNENKKLSQFFNVAKHYQKKINVSVKDKNKILNCKKFEKYLKNLQNSLINNCRIFVRASGTENVLRVFVESKENKQSECVANQIKDFLLECDKEIS